MKSLKAKTGINKQVGEHIKTDPAWGPFIKNFKSLLKPLLPRYAQEGKSYLTIAVGCSVGRHRSVFTVRELDLWLKDMGYTAHIEHRDLRL